MEVAYVCVAGNGGCVAPEDSHPGHIQYCQGNIVSELPEIAVVVAESRPPEASAVHVGLRAAVSCCKLRVKGICSDPGLRCACVCYPSDAACREDAASFLAIPMHVSLLIHIFSSSNAAGCCIGLCDLYTVCSARANPADSSAHTSAAYQTNHY